MIHKPLRWTVPVDTTGSELEAAVEAMNLHAPFHVGDEIVRRAPMHAQLVDGRFRVVSDWTLKPDLVVEVLSPSTPAEDRGPKRVEYEAEGKPEYVLVDPEARTVDVLRLEQGRYVPVARGPDGWPSAVLGCAWRPDEALG